MSKLRTAVKELASALSGACPTQQLKGLTSSEEEGQVVLHAVDADDNQIVINVLFLDPDQYPRSGALLELSEGSSKGDRLAVALSAMSERFQDAAQLCAIISKVCAALDIPVDEDMLRGAEKSAAGVAGGNGVADDGAASGSEAMDEDASDDPMSEDYPASSDGADGSDGGFDGLVDDEEEKEVMIQCGQRQGRWARFEEELAAANAKAEQVLSMEEGKASKQQIFSSHEATQMLSNELLGQIRRQLLGQDTNVMADSDGDDLYTWNVQLWRSGFRPDCQLSKDLAEVSSKYAISSIQLRFKFMRGLHPFYPPRVEVVRPHLSTPLPGALASYPLLRLGNWDPLMTMPQLFDHLRTFLEDHGRIDVSNPGNKQAESAFSAVEMALARLEGVSDVKPACYSQYKELYEARSTHSRPSDAGEPTSPQAKAAKKARTNEAEAAPAAAGAAAAGAAAAGGAAGAAAGAGAAAAAAGAGGVVWARGTGYGYNVGVRGTGGPVWDAKKAAAAQEAHDEQLRSVLTALAAALSAEFPSSSSSIEAAAGAAGSAGAEAEAGPSAAASEPQAGAPAEADAAGPSSSSGRQQQQQRRKAQAASELTLTPSQEQCLAAVRSSVLRPLLVRDLSQVAFTEMVTRHQYFTPLLSIVEALCHPAFEEFLAGNAAEEEAAAAAGGSSTAAAQQSRRACSVAGSLRGLQKGAAIVRKELSKALQQQQAAPGSSSGKVDKQAEAVKQQAELSLQVADLVLGILQKLDHLTTAEEEAAAQAALTPPKQTQPASAAPARRTTRAAAAAAAAAADAAPAQAAAAGPSNEDAGSRAAAYVAALKPLVMESAHIAEFHRFKTEAATDPMGLKARVQRVTSEMAGIERLIEVNESSSIFVRVDEDNAFLWKVLITGPEDTPYSGGAFLFDMFFPPNYPAIPPKVLITTTGGGLVRFNPNLYNCGKVCLSLLGTWSGAQGESWSPDASSAFQVLVSIQSLILVPEPYFNEPGYEQRGNRAQSIEYNKVIREATIKWAMIDQLQKPPAAFADVIKTHFRLRAPYILKQVSAWIEEAPASGHKTRLQELHIQLKAELDKLN